MTVIIPFVSPDDVNYQFAYTTACGLDADDLRIMMRVLKARQKNEPDNPALPASIQAISKHLRERANGRYDKRWHETAKETLQQKSVVFDELIRDLTRNRRPPVQLEMVPPEGTP